MPETWVQSLGREDPLEEEMATHSSVLVWEVLWTEEPGGLQSMGWQSWTRPSTRAYTATPLAQDLALNKDSIRIVKQTVAFLCG